MPELTAAEVTALVLLLEECIKTAGLLMALAKHDQLVKRRNLTESVQSKPLLARLARLDDPEPAA